MPYDDVGRRQATPSAVIGMTPAGANLDSRALSILNKSGFAVASLKNNSSSMSLNLMADKDDLLLNSREVAFLLDLSPDAVNEMARRNAIPAFKKGRQWRFRKRDITLFKRQLKGLNVAA
jgi:excisionase family DNA binding protein